MSLIKMMKNSISIMIIGILIVSSISAINATSISIVSIPTSQNTEMGSIDVTYDDATKLDFVPGEIIVKLKDNVKISVISNQNYVVTGLDTIDSLNEKFGINSIEKLAEKETISFLSNVYKLKFSQEKTISPILDDYLKDPNVEYAEPNFIYRICSLPNDPYFSKQWGLDQSNDVDIDAPEAWNLETGNKNVVIAVIDSGIDYNHPDLKDNVWINKKEIPNNNIDDDGNGFVDDVRGWDFISNTNDPKDELGHGTHCAGIVGAVGNNNIGITGVCWNCSIMSVKIFSALGVTDLGLLVRGINYAADNGANVISMSWGTYGYSEILKDSIDYAYSKGSVLVAAAGNEATYYKSYPASYDNVISVAAINSNNAKAFFSNYGAWVDVAAPGVDIYSTMPTYHVTLNDEPYGCNIGYSYMSGTSMSCPYVAGVAGLILSKNPNLSQDEIKTLIHSAVSKVNSSTYIGTGNINAFECIQNSDAVPLAFLDSLLDEKEIDGVIEIRGTASGITFKEFKIYLGFGAYPESWNLISTSNISVENNVLTMLNTSLYKDGVHSIKLEVNDTHGYKFEDRTIVLINNNKTTVYVDDDGPADYKKISEAANNSGSGDRIFVYNGTYYETVIIAKSISLIGENKNTTTIVGLVVYRKTQNVQVSGFTFRQTKPPIYNTNSMGFQSSNYKYQYGPSATTAIVYEYPCLAASACYNVTIKNNIFINYTAPLLKTSMKGYTTLFRGVGIDLGGCSACLVKDNIIIGHIYDPSIKKEGNSPTVGIELLSCSSVFVENNLILNNNALQRKNVEEGSILSFTNESLPAGISVDGGTSNFINDNKIENNFKGIQGFGEMYSGISNNLLIRNTHGIYFDMASAFSCNIHHNLIKDNKNGISLGVACLYNNIYNNIIENNTIGIKGLDFALKIFEGLMPDSQYNTICNNSIKNNDIGVYGKNWANNTICDNNIENNKKIGLKMVKSKRNSIYRNNFINDGILIFGKRNAKSSIGNKWDNGIEGNYWDDYRGLRFKRLVDRDKDGFGNIPYRIPRLQFDRHPKLEPYNIVI